MSRLDELLKQEELEIGVSKIIDFLNRKPEQTNGMMRPKLAACSETDRSITLEFPVQEWQLNSENVMHGGIIATAFDIALGVFAHYLNHNLLTVTVSISINYLKPVPAADSLLVTAKATSLGKRIITLSAEGRLKSSGQLTNTAIGTFAIVKSESSPSDN